jgi:hypothetical protein
MSIRAFTLACLVLTALACGGNPCDSLKCDQCDNKGTKMACEAVVKSDNERACEVALDQANFKTCQ